MSNEGVGDHSGTNIRDSSSDEAHIPEKPSTNNGSQPLIDSRAYEPLTSEPIDDESSKPTTSQDPVTQDEKETSESTKPAFEVARDTSSPSIISTKPINTSDIDAPIPALDASQFLSTISSLVGSTEPNQEVEENESSSNQENEEITLANEPIVSPSASTTSIEQKPLFAAEKEETDLDLSSIASSLNVDDDLLASIDTSVLLKIQNRINQASVLESEKLVLEVKLEQSNHLGNKRAELIKSQLHKVQQENMLLKEETASLQASKELSNKKLFDLELKLKSQNSEDLSYKSKLESVLAESRDAIGLLEKKNTEIEGLKLEYSEIQKSNSGLRRELITLETTTQAANSTATQLKLKLQSTESQIDLLNKSNEWLNNELQKINTDFADYRRQKSTELLTLQSEFEDISSERNSLKSRYDGLNKRFEDVFAQLDHSHLEIKKLTDEKNLAKEEFFNEISVKDRLTNLLKQANDDLKHKNEYLGSKLDESKSEISSESATLKTSLDDYKRQLEKSEAKIQQLEATIDDLSRGPPTDGDHLSSVHSFSPSARATAAKDNGISLSQLYSDFTLVKRQLIQERRAKERMQRQIDAFVSELERKAPLINATKERANTLEKELTQLSVILEKTTKEKEELEKSKKSLATELNEAHAQTTSLNKQRTDLARQVQNLLVQVTIRGDSFGPLTPLEQQALTRIANGDKVVNESDTGRLISERLVVFQDIVELQKKNEELLRITRDLAEKLEHQEQASKSRLESLENSAVTEAKEAILTLTDEIESIESKLNAVTRERDIFRSMLAGKGDTSNILGSNNIVSHEASELSEKYQTAQAELEALQKEFSQLKVESATTIELLNKQIDSLSKERSELAFNLAREKSTATLLDQRYKSLQENLKLSRSENDELTKRSQLLQENFAKQDIRTQHVSEELVQTRSLVESLRSEASNLKAEKQIWKAIESRLTEENKSLIDEKIRLNSLLLNVQSLEQEREHNSAEAQRRSVLQTESLEKELSNLKERLVNSEKELKTVFNKKEVDSNVYQERIETLRLELAKVNDELANKKTLIESLETKVETLSKKLSSTEDNLKDYQNLASTDGSKSNLITETINLKSELQDTKVELEEANNSIERFKSIAESSEEALNSLTASFDSYKSETSDSITRLESEKKLLQEQVSLLNEQTQLLNGEIESSKSETAKKVESLNNEINKSRSSVIEFSKIKEDYEVKITAIEESYQQQVLIATEAQRNYEKELQKHVDVSKAVSSLREESNALKIQVQQLSSESKSAKTELAKSEESWEAQKASLAEELKIVTDRVQDLTSQNHILYNQIDNLSKQRQITTENTNSSSLPFEGAAENELRELISLLRNEKEISETQLDVATRDLKRTRQQLDISNSELDKVRLELVKLQASDADIERLSKEHEHVLKEIEQLSLLRESNTTLRAELQANLAKVKELESKLDSSLAKVEPLETQVAQLKAEIGHKDQEVKLVVEEKERWKLRSQEILSKYDRIDPEEHNELKKEIEQLKTRIDELSKHLSEEQTKFADLDGRFTTLRTEAQEKLKRRGAENKTLQAQLSGSTAELKKLKESSEAEVTKLTSDLNALKEKSNSTTTDDNEILKEENNTLKKEAEVLSKDFASQSEELQKAKEFESQYKQAVNTIDQLKARVAELEKDVSDLTEELKKSQTATAGSDSASDNEILKKELETEREEISSAKDLLEAERAEILKLKEEFEKVKSGSESNVTVDGTAELDEKAKQAALTELEAKLRSELQVEYDTKLEQHKSRIRVPAEQRLQEIAEKRAEKVRQEAEEEYKKKLDELKKQFKSSKGSENIKKQYEVKINELTETLEKTKKQSYEEGREATLKEVTMRTKLLQGKIDKLNREKKELEAKLKAVTEISTPDIPTQENKPEVTSQLPATPSLSVKTDAPTEEVEAESSGVKRPVEELDTSEHTEKKSKNDA